MSCSQQTAVDVRPAAMRVDVSRALDAVEGAVDGLHMSPVKLT
jgi:hypothetical protein